MKRLRPRTRSKRTKMLSRMVPSGELLDGVHLGAQGTVFRRDTGCPDGSTYLLASTRLVHQCKLTPIRVLRRK
jgi:hypothetical protein